MRPVFDLRSFRVVATRRSLAGTHTASRAPVQDPEWLIEGLTPPQQAISPAGIDKNQTDSLAPIGTFARHRDCLAKVSLFLFRRSYLAARDQSRPASSPDSLQGTSEKIHFDRLVCKYPFKSKNLLAQYELAGTSNWSVCVLQSVTPVVEQVTSHPDLPREPRDVVARVHSLHGLLSKFLAVSLTSFVVHSEPPFQLSVQYGGVSLHFPGWWCTKGA